MIRVLSIFLLTVLLGFLFLQGRLHKRVEELPIFLLKDKIAIEHNTNIDIKVESLFQPDSFQLQTLKKDYSNIWAHLNYLYTTNDIEAGKEYYTENWFKQLAKHHNSIQKPLIFRTDEKHNLIIKNWATDGLVCTAIDSNVIFKYQYTNNIIKSTKANIAIILLLQGDHWRVDAIKVISE